MWPNIFLFCAFTAAITLVTVVVVAYAFRSHNWSAKQRHHHLQSVVWTSHRVVLSVGRIRQYVTSFGSHRRNTGRSLWVSICFYKHHSDLVRYGSGSGETNVVEGEQNPAVGLSGRPWGGHWTPKPTSRILSTTVDVNWFQLTPQRRDHSNNVTNFEVTIRVRLPTSTVSWHRSSTSWWWSWVDVSHQRRKKLHFKTVSMFSIMLQVCNNFFKFQLNYGKPFKWISLFN